MTCAFDACNANECALVGGCLQVRFPGQSTSVSDVKSKQPALNGTKPGRSARRPAEQIRKAAHS